MIENIEYATLHGMMTVEVDVPHPDDRFVCDSITVVDRPDYTTRAALDAPTGGWTAEHDWRDDTYRVSYPALSDRVRTYRRDI